MSDSSKMEYRFVSFRLFIAGFAILIALFLFSWIPSAHIDLTVNSEPLIVSFEMLLDQSAKSVLFNLDTIPAQIVSFSMFKNKKEYIIIDDLKSEESNTMLVFKQSDIKELIAYKADELLKGSEAEKQVFGFHPDSWEIRVLKKDILGSATVLVFIQEEVILEYDFKNLKDVIRFKSAREAKNMLTSISGIKHVKIDLFPPLYQRLPVFGGRMSFFVHP
ncbi:hypothetical protein MYX07_01430 [Patescibacteria group bacterium AH-259-L07]|nr:hypothetical protein [Patescibacteria group bacterium AH-259-L07]